MNEHPIEGLMVTAMDSIRDMIDVNTIITSQYVKKENEEEVSYKLPFGGGSGARCKY